MPNWKKVLLSGSKASVFDITASNLPNEVSSTNNVITIDSNGHFQEANRADFGGGASGPDRSVQFAYTQDGGATFLLSGSEFLLFDEPNKELIISASGEGAINIGRDGGISNGDVLGSLNFIGTGSAIIEGPSAIIRAKAIQDFSANTKGAKLEFFAADNQETTLSNGIPELTISGSRVSSSVNLSGKALITSDGDILTEFFGGLTNVLSIGSNTIFGYNQWGRVDMQGGNGGFRFLSPVTSSYATLGEVTASDFKVTGDANIVGNAIIDDIKVVGHKIQDGNSTNNFIDFSDDIDIASGTDVRVIIDTNNSENTSLFEVRADGTSEGASRRIFYINQSGSVSASGHMHVEGDITSSGTVKAEGLALNLTSQTDDARNLMVYYLGELYSSNITLGKTKYVEGTGIDRSGTGPYTFSIDLSELTDMTAEVVGSQDELILLDNGAQRRKQLNEIKLGQFNNDQNWTSNTGTVTGTYGASGRVAIWSGANVLTNDSGLSFNTTSNVLSIDGGSTGGLIIERSISHSGDFDTNISFYTDEIQLRAGQTANDNYLILKGSEKRNLMKGGLQIRGDAGTTWGIHLSASTDTDLSSADDSTGGEGYIDILNDRSGNANPIGGIRWKNTNSGELGTVAGILSYNENYSVATSDGTVTAAAGDRDGTLEFHTADNNTNKKALVLAHNGQSHFPETANFGSNVYIHGDLYMSSLGNNTGYFPVKYDTAGNKFYYDNSRRATKNNIITIGDKNSTLTTDVFSSIKPRTFTYKNRPNHLTAGFIAEELAEVSPVLANWGPNTFIDKEGNIDNQNLINDDIVPVDIDDRAMLALCVAKIQELEAELKELKTKLP